MKTYVDDNVSEFGSDSSKMVEAGSTSMEIDLTSDKDSWYWIPESQRERQLEDEYILGDIIGR
jgi:hypothetical protein